MEHQTLRAESNPYAKFEAEGIEAISKAILHLSIILRTESLVSAFQKGFNTNVVDTRKFVASLNDKFIKSMSVSQPSVGAAIVKGVLLQVSDGKWLYDCLRSAYYQ